jgi:hypothetical protein
MIVSPLSGNVLGSVGDALLSPSGRTQAAPPDHLGSSHHCMCTIATTKHYVLEGTLRVLVGKDEVEARAGSGVFVPRETAHTYWNPGPAPVRYLLIMTSNIYSLIKEIHAMQSRTPAALRAVFGKYDSDLLDQ